MQQPSFGFLFTDDCGFFLGSQRELKEAHAAELTALKNKYKAALEAEKLAAQEKLGTFGPERMTMVKGREKLSCPWIGNS